jgi:uncharacterized protein (DUF2147 family)
MRRLKLAFIAAVTMGIPAHASDSSDIYGTWATPKNNGRVEVVPCGGQVCAKILDGKQIRANPAQADVLNPDPAKRTRLVKGLYILEGFSGGPDKWSGGSVYDPQTGDSSNDSTLEVVGPGKLRVTGCRIIFCRSETWRKLSS